VQRLLATVLTGASIGLATGCGSENGAPLPVSAAPPQRAELGWTERTPATGSALVFRVHSFAVTESGWEADVEIENRTEIDWEVGADRVAVEQSFGIMLFATGELAELEQRNREGDLPGLRPVQSFVPALSARLAPGARWRGIISAGGTLASGRYVRVVFGPLVALGDPPPGMRSELVWITDHAYRLRGRGATVDQQSSSTKPARSAIVFA
jgi:hypothetical protein